MCTACVAQGIAYVGGAVGTLRVMAARAEHRRKAKAVEAHGPEEPVDVAATEPVGRASG